MEKQEEQYRIVAQQSFLPVISLEFISLGNSEILLAGKVFACNIYEKLIMLLYANNR